MHLFEIHQKRLERHILNELRVSFNTAQKTKFSIKDFFSKWYQIHRKLRILSHFLRKSLMEDFFLSSLISYLVWNILNNI